MLFMFSHICEDIKICISFTVWIVLFPRFFLGTDSCLLKRQVPFKSSASLKFLNYFHLLQLNVVIHEVLPPNDVHLFLYAIPR